MKRPAEGPPGAITPLSLWSEVKEWMRTQVFPHDPQNYEKAVGLVPPEEEPDGEVLLAMERRDITEFFGGNRAIGWKLDLHLRPIRQALAAAQAAAVAVVPAAAATVAVPAAAPAAVGAPGAAAAAAVAAAGPAPAADLRATSPTADPAARTAAEASADAATAGGGAALSAGLQEQQQRPVQQDAQASKQRCQQQQQQQGKPVQQMHAAKPLHQDEEEDEELEMEVADEEEGEEELHMSEESESSTDVESSEGSSELLCPSHGSSGSSSEDEDGEAASSGGSAGRADSGEGSREGSDPSLGAAAAALAEAAAAPAEAAAGPPHWERLAEQVAADGWDATAADELQPPAGICWLEGALALVNNALLLAWPSLQELQAAAQEAGMRLPSDSLKLLQRRFLPALTRQVKQQAAQLKARSGMDASCVTGILKDVALLNSTQSKIQVELLLTAATSEAEQAGGGAGGAGGSCDAGADGRCDGIPGQQLVCKLYVKYADMLNGCRVHFFPRSEQEDSPTEPIDMLRLFKAMDHMQSGQGAAAMHELGRKEARFQQVSAALAARGLPENLTDDIQLDQIAQLLAAVEDPPDVPEPPDLRQRLSAVLTKELRGYQVQTVLRILGGWPQLCQHYVLMALGHLLLCCSRRCQSQTVCRWACCAEWAAAEGGSGRNLWTQVPLADPSATRLTCCLALRLHSLLLDHSKTFIQGSTAQCGASVILVSSMGTGKTACIIAAALLMPPPPGWRQTGWKEPAPGDAMAAHVSNLFHGGWLIIVPVSLLGQWEAEIKAWVKPEAGLKYIVWHGPDRFDRHSLADLASARIVLATPPILSREMGDAHKQAQMQRGRMVHELSDIRWWAKWFELQATMG
ncbi:hypothetical protein ABPG75_007705 [Micractinium tetrahymenae]